MILWVVLYILLRLSSESMPTSGEVWSRRRRAVISSCGECHCVSMLDFSVQSQGPHCSKSKKSQVEDERENEPVSIVLVYIIHQCVEVVS
mmetsp:Transcript_8323/g.25023  ORF Transcript_8323/g.25023 Transcript_8323/m.25023 type:complete len:90 (+) Transcript_8323:222-491(+)